MKELTESLEKYLRAVYEIIQNQKTVKVKDVSDYLKIGGPATSEAIKTLAARGFVEYVPYGEITLTTKGCNAVDLKIYRHKTISKFLSKVLDIEETTAEKNATAIEYSMTEDVLIKLVHFMDFMEQCTCKEPKWIKSCKQSLDNGEMSAKCSQCKSQGETGCCGCHGNN